METIVLDKNSHPFREWIRSWVYEIANVGGIGRVETLVHLATVPGKDEELDGVPEVQQLGMTDNSKISRLLEKDPNEATIQAVLPGNRGHNSQSSLKG